VLSVLFFGLMGGWLIAGIVGGVWIGSKFIGRQSKAFIVAACVLAPFTLIVFFYVGLFAAVPFAVYNVIIIRRSYVTLELKEHCTIVKPILKFAHNLLEDALQPGDIAVDCTMGNGHDTLFLAKLVGKKGHVFAFDIQENALQSTRKLLVQHRVDRQVTLIRGSHASLEGCIPLGAHRNIKAAVFNLGYLPGGDKSICTEPSSTIKAIETLIRILLPGGIIVLVVYTGHQEGEAEAKKVQDYCKQLPQSTVNVAEYRLLNNPNKPPFVIAIEKL